MAICGTSGGDHQTSSSLSMDQSTFGSLLIPILLGKLPEDIKLHVTRKIHSVGDLEFEGAHYNTYAAKVEIIIQCKVHFP